jgi:hypothetical protein
MKLKSLFVALFVLILTNNAYAQQSGTPSTLRIRIDANGYLVLSAAAQTNPVTTSVFGNARLKTDSSGNLLVVLTSGAAPSDATYITQTPNATLTNEQALSTLSTGLMNVTTTTGVVTSIANVAANQVLTSGTPAVYSASPRITAIGLGAAAPAAGLSFANGSVLTDTALGTVAMISSATTNAIRIPNGSGLEYGSAGWISNFYDLGVVTNGGTARSIRLKSTNALVFAAGSGTSDFWQINSSGHFLTINDNTYDIGASAATRPRTVYVATSVISPLVSGALNGVGAPAVTSVANVGANSCGTTSATIAGSNNTGIVTVGATSGTQCRILFSKAATTRRQCTVTNETTANLARTAYVDTTHNDLLGVFVAGDTLSYVCLDY